MKLDTFGGLGSTKRGQEMKLSNPGKIKSRTKKAAPKAKVKARKK